MPDIITPQSGLMTIDTMAQELSRRIGVRPNFEGRGGAIERAINDAYQQIILRYKIAEFMADTPYYFDSEIVVGTSAANAKDASEFTVDDPTDKAALAAVGERLVDSYMRFGTGSGGCYHVTGVLDAAGVPADRWSRTSGSPDTTGDLTVQVAPTIPVAHVSGTNGDFTVVIRRYRLPFTYDDMLMPDPENAGGGYPFTFQVDRLDGTSDEVVVDREDVKPAFYIYDLSEITSQIPVRMVDVRLFDRSVPIMGQTVYYARVNNDIFLHPAPVVSNPSNTSAPAKFRMRFAYRPSYKRISETFPPDAPDTLDPMPQEWQEVVMLEAFAKLLDSLVETERAQMIRASAEKLAESLLKPWIEEIEDAEPSLQPVRDRSII